MRSSGIIRTLTDGELPSEAGREVAFHSTDLTGHKSPLALVGYPDGNYMPARLQARLAEEIVNVVKVPVSVDFEAGYSNQPAVVVKDLKPLAAVGIAGINIEDGTDAPALLAKQIEAIKKMASSLGVDIFVNARTDVYHQDLVADEKKVQETLDRAAVYRSAGADGLFVPGLSGTRSSPLLAAEIWSTRRGKPRQSGLLPTWSGKFRNYHHRWPV